MTYTVNDKTYDSCSAINRAILRQFVQDSVLCSATSELEYIIRCLQRDPDSKVYAPFSLEEYEIAIRNATSIPHICENCSADGEFEHWDSDSAPEKDFHDDDFDPDDLLYTCPICGLCYATLEEARECCADETAVQCTHCGRIYSDTAFSCLKSEPDSIDKWYIVDAVLGPELRERGEVIIDGWGRYYWGRRGSGVSLKYESVIVDIAYSLEILQGQKHDMGDTLL